MSTLLFLTYEDFSLKKDPKGMMMCCNIQGISLILFYSNECDHCQKFIPLFKKLPGTVGNCQFGMINVSKNKECILMSRNSIAPITEVPYIILFINGKPFMRYKGPNNIQELSTFIVEVAKKFQTTAYTQQSSSNGLVEQRTRKDNKSQIPAYTVGKPVEGEEEVCYLEFQEAYNHNLTGHNLQLGHLSTVYSTFDGAYNKK